MDEIYFGMNFDKKPDDLSVTVATVNPGTSELVYDRFENMDRFLIRDGVLELINKDNICMGIFANGTWVYFSVERNRKGHIELSPDDISSEIAIDIHGNASRSYVYMKREEKGRLYDVEYGYLIFKEKDNNLPIAVFAAGKWAYYRGSQK